MALTCTKCGTPKRVRQRSAAGKRRFIYCPTCQSRAVQAYKARYPERRRAREIVRNAKKRGRLVPQPCERCGTTEGVHGHHDDYRKPLEVRWFCPPHHRERHREMRVGDG